MRPGETVSAKEISVSVVVPLFNEVATLPELVERLQRVLEPALAGKFEILLVDDGSSDASWRAIEALTECHSGVVSGLRLRRNFGKAAALSEGFRAARGEVIVSMDADLQDLPEEVPKFLDALQDPTVDLVSGWKQNRQDPIDKTLPSWVFNRLTAWLSGVRLHDFNCGFKAYRADCAKQLRFYGELHRFIPVLAHADGFVVREIAVRHAARASGKTKYGYSRLLKGFLDLLSVVVLGRYLRRPMHFFGGLGFLSGGLGLAILGYLSALKLFWAVGGIGTRPLFFLGLLLTILGVQLCSIGILGELIIKLNAHDGKHKGQRLGSRCG